jgi:hypothetical protein
LTVPTSKGLHQAHAAALRAYQREDLWPDGVREALRALLDFLGDDPDFVHAFAIERRHAPGNDQQLAAAREAFTAFLTPGHDADADLPLLTADLITGGILHIVTRYALDDRVAELPSTLAELTRLALGPYLPADEVLRAVRGC